MTGLAKGRNTEAGGPTAVTIFDSQKEKKTDCVPVPVPIYPEPHAQDANNGSLSIGW